MTTLTAFQGMNNRAKPNALPDGQLRNAVNVLFDDAGNVRLPRPGKTVKYAGDCHSIFKTPTITLFSEGGSLKRLNSDNTVTTLKTGIGTSRVYYTEIADTIYFCNELVSGKIVNGAFSEWGCDAPPRQPTCTATDFGGLFAGDYRVAITWISDEESGTGNSVKVTVNEGGGIHLTNFPAPPSYVQMIGVYVSSVNGEDLYLYDNREFPANTTDITLGRAISNIPLQTQFKTKPKPQGVIVAHYGRIYYAKGSLVYFTDPHRYGLQSPNNFFPFDSAVQTINSCQNVLYVGTQEKLAKVLNIDGDGEPVCTQVLDAGTTKGSECYDPDGNHSYLMSDKGFVRLGPDPEPIVALTYDKCAIPLFELGTMTVTEYDGLKYLVFAGQNGQQNPLADKDYSIAELTRGSL